MILSRRRGPGIQTSVPKFLLATKELRGRPSFETSEWSSRLVQNRVGYVPASVSPGPGVGNERTNKIPPQPNQPN